MLAWTGIPLYLLIFVGKVLEVTMSTLRIIFVGKGRKLVGVAFGLIEVSVGLIITSLVLNDLYSDPFKIVVYVAAFEVGISLGMTIEGRMALGLTSMQAVATEEQAHSVGLALREAGFGVTILRGHSVDGTQRDMVFVQLRRRRVDEAVHIVQSTAPQAVISVSDIKSIKGGFLK
jgi:uncharacterized protein YebE (UPF0316 family)